MSAARRTVGTSVRTRFPLLQEMPPTFLESPSDCGFPQQRQLNPEADRSDADKSEATSDVF